MTSDENTVCTPDRNVCCMVTKYKSINSYEPIDVLFQTDRCKAGCSHEPFLHIVVFHVFIAVYITLTANVKEQSGPHREEVGVDGWVLTQAFQAGKRSSCPGENTRLSPRKRVFMSQEWFNPNPNFSQILTSHFGD